MQDKSMIQWLISWARSTENKSDELITEELIAFMINMGIIKAMHQSALLYNIHEAILAAMQDAKLLNYAESLTLLAITLPLNIPHQDDHALKDMIDTTEEKWCTK